MRVQSSVDLASYPFRAGWTQRRKEKIDHARSEIRTSGLSLGSQLAYQTLDRSCNAAPPSSGVPLSYLMMNDSPVSMKAGDYLQSLPRSDAVQIFRARARHTLLLADRARHGWSTTTACRLCGERDETITHVLSECREVVGDRPSGWPAVPVNEILWCGDRVAMSTAAKIMRKFLRAMQ
ncbi:hypothetical protein PoB_001889400 [Plakobranchus ocellatus]|uniref:Reverse transcriptase zinc-binding domain-containing protein n=1 Tax=Plakobranchus ocellatus TaxID=259542 RepID=A0AAV3ZDC3_9GAST|nr:hypothetical protein PoB_001889400 [Plakobranchus ocellatus]